MYALLDMDSFYAQVECARLGLSNDVPLGVKQHEHFIAVNYAARKRGVPSRCSVERARQICPEVVTAEVEMIHDVKPSLERYRRASESVVNILLEFVKEEHLEKASIDEAYLDLSALCRDSPIDNRITLNANEKVICLSSDIATEPLDERIQLLKASNIMNQVRERIYNRLGFTSSCGIAHNKLLAKIAASKNKPAGQTIVFKSGAKLLMRTTSLRKIRGLGGKLGKQLENLVKTVRSRVQPDGYDLNEDENVLAAIQREEVGFSDLEKEFGTKTARYITSRANGEDDSVIVSKMKPKTLLSIKTFYHSLSFSQVQDWLRLESDELARRAIQDNKLFNRRPRTLVLHFHSNGGEHFTRRTAFHAVDLSDETSMSENIYRTSEALLRNIDKDKEGSRGIGIGLENFSDSLHASDGSELSTIPKITKFFTRAETAEKQPNQGINSLVEQEVQVLDSEIKEESEEDEGVSGDEAVFDVDYPSSGVEDEFAEEMSDLAAEEDTDHDDHYMHRKLTAAEVVSRAMMQRPQTSREAGASNFVSRFFKASRLSFIGSWKRRFESLLEDIPAPPPLAPPKFNERVIVHIDMDAFFCSASLLKRPDLVDQAVAVCWSSAMSETASASASEISSCNYLARSHGVKAGMSLARAKRLCPELTCIPFDFDLYERIGMLFYRVLFETTPHVEGVSCDEAYLDITHLVSDKNHVSQLIEALRAKVFKETGVTASAGAGRNRLIARLSTSRAKPNKSMSSSFSSDDELFTNLLNDNVDVGSLPSIGYSTCEKLKKELEVSNVKELRTIPLGRLQHFFGPKIGEKMHQLCRGIDKRPWNPRPERDTVSVQISWGVRMQNLKEVHDFIAELAKECYQRLGTREGDTVVLRVWRAVENQPEFMRKGLVGSGICDVFTRSKPQTIRGDLGNTTAAASAIAPKQYERMLRESGIELFNELKTPPEDIRGMGLAISGLAKKSASTVRQRKIAATASTSSKWVEGLGLVKRQKQSGEQRGLQAYADAATEADDRIDYEVLKEAVAKGNDFCCGIIEKELVFAFVETHCIRWPACQTRLCRDCFDKNREALRDCAELIKSLIEHGASDHLLKFAKFKAQTGWGTLPDFHPITHFSNMGGGVQFFCEYLEDLEA